MDIETGRVYPVLAPSLKKMARTGKGVGSSQEWHELRRELVINVGVRLWLVAGRWTICGQLLSQWRRSYI